MKDKGRISILSRVLASLLLGAVIFGVLACTARGEEATPTPALTYTPEPTFTPKFTPTPEATSTPTLQEKYQVAETTYYNALTNSQKASTTLEKAKADLLSIRSSAAIAESRLSKAKALLEKQRVFALDRQSELKAASELYLKFNTEETRINFEQARSESMRAQSIYADMLLDFSATANALGNCITSSRWPDICGAQRFEAEPQKLSAAEDTYNKAVANYEESQIKLSAAEEELKRASEALSGKGE